MIVCICYSICAHHIWSVILSSRIYMYHKISLQSVHFMNKKAALVFFLKTSSALVTFSDNVGFCLSFTIPESNCRLHHYSKTTGYEQN